MYPNIQKALQEIASDNGLRVKQNWSANLEGFDYNLDQIDSTLAELEGINDGEIWMDYLVGEGKKDPGWYLDQEAFLHMDMFICQAFDGELTEHIFG